MDHQDAGRLGETPLQTLNQDKAVRSKNRWADDPQRSLWQWVAAARTRTVPAEIERRIVSALSSPAVEFQQATLERNGLRVEREPILWKWLPGLFLRLFFPVSGPTEEIERGTVVALVLLFDPATDRALYAHPVHAGPDANPLLMHMDGPMAQPQAQAGANGDRTTRRLLDHKRAIWDCFLRERDAIGSVEASRRWRTRFCWALLQLYFCERCPACRWGVPYFDGAPGELYRVPQTDRNTTAPVRSSADQRAVDTILQSDAWQVEVEYIRRGEFTIRETPKVFQPREAACVVGFPTDTEFIQGGSIVGLCAYLDEPGGRVLYVHTLCAGPEAEIQFLRGDSALGLPWPSNRTAAAEARATYCDWRRKAWSQFWLDELELGIHEASLSWLDAYWAALERLFAAGS